VDSTGFEKKELSVADWVADRSESRACFQKGQATEGIRNEGYPGNEQKESKGTRSGAKERANKNRMSGATREVEPRQGLTKAEPVGEW